MKRTENLEQLARSMIKSRFSEYYKKNENSVIPPRSMEQREFGFLIFAEGIMIRHRSFRHASDLKRFIENTVPSDVYYSAAYYSNPEAPMDMKGWNGSDLIFDIDADHIETECKQTHDKWLCIECKTSGKGKAPQNCPGCGGQKFEEDTWMCLYCLEKAKQEILRLIDLLSKDFGIDPKKMEVNFSGHRGYHLHVESEEVENLGSEERKELVDYITGTGLEANLLGLLDLSGKLQVTGGPRPSDPGWRGRLAKRVDEMLLRTDEEELKSIGLKSNIIESLMRLRDEADPRREMRFWGVLEGAGKQTWQLIIRKAASLESIAIDTVVTTDIHRLIRLPETLNGKTGLRAMRVKTEELTAYSPLTQAVAFEGNETVHVQETPRFMIGGKEYGPFKDVDETLPTAAAVLLLCKGKAHPVAD